MTPTPLPHDLSITSLILQADPIVQAVMALLVLASIICWVIIFEKIIALSRLNSKARTFERIVSGTEQGTKSPGLLSSLTKIAEEEVAEGTTEGETRKELRARIEASMKGAIRSELRRHERGLPFLATIGSTAPFIGLFGTVWGIMNSFTSIAEAKNTSLAVVAPGIAEALFATALGLVAAIPAVIAYNQTTVALGRTSQIFNTAIAQFARRKTRPQPEPLTETTASAA